jgi:hypothetical protein
VRGRTLDGHSSYAPGSQQGTQGEEPANVNRSKIHKS